MIRGLALSLAVCAAFAQAPSAYRAEIEKWRADRAAGLLKDDGWLTVAGLFWLQEGENRVGAAASNQIVLPPGSAPARIGEFTFRSGKTVFTAEPGVTVTSDGKSVDKLEMQPDTSGSPTTIRIGALSMWVIHRGDRFGIRLRDLNSQARKQFQGLSWFEVSESWRIRARWVPYNPPKKVSILNIVGITEEASCPGYASFEIGGKDYRLEPTAEGGRLFFVFRDLTAGKETYPAGRFLYADAPKGGYVLLDFNRAYNPPCAFTPYATCPLPLPQNRLPLRIPAGEMNHPAADLLGK